MPNLADAILVLFPNSTPRIDWNVVQDNAGTRIAFWNAALGTQPTQAQTDAVTQGQVDAFRAGVIRGQAVNTFLNDHSNGAVVLRGLTLALVDQLNVIAGQLQALRDAVRVVAPSIPAVTYTQITPAQAATAVQNKINSGTVD